MHHHVLVHLRPEIEVSIMDTILRTSRLDQPNLKVVWHKEGVVLLDVLSVVETTQVDVVMATQVTSSLFKRVTS